jgi:hypothetical protein
MSIVELAPMLQMHIGTVVEGKQNRTTTRAAISHVLTGGEYAETLRVLGGTVIGGLSTSIAVALLLPWSTLLDTLSFMSSNNVPLVLGFDVPTGEVHSRILQSTAATVFRNRLHMIVAGELIGTKLMLDAVTGVTNSDLCVRRPCPSMDVRRDVTGVPFIMVTVSTSETNTRTVVVSHVDRPLCVAVCSDVNTRLVMYTRAMVGCTGHSDVDGSSIECK